MELDSSRQFLVAVVDTCGSVKELLINIPSWYIPLQYVRLFGTGICNVLNIAQRCSVYDPSITVLFVNGAAAGSIFIWEIVLLKIFFRNFELIQELVFNFIPLQRS